MSTAICLDLDGTVTAEEILPRIAAEVNLADEIGILTDATLKGILPFEKSFRLRCRLLADVPISRVREIVADIKVDDAIAHFVRRNAERCFIVTGNLDVWIEPLTARLGCSSFSSTSVVAEDRLVGISAVLDKRDAIASTRKSFDKVVAVGDSFNDAGMFELADVSIAYGGVHSPVPALYDLADFAVTNGKALCRLLDTL